MKHEIASIYRQLAAGELSQEQALQQIRRLKRGSAPETPATALAIPQWQPLPEASAHALEPAPDYAAHSILLCGLPSSVLPVLATRLPQARCSDVGARSTAAGTGDPAADFNTWAMASLERVRELLQSGPQAPCLLQLVVAEPEAAQFGAGFAGLLESAALENPLLLGQVLLVPAAIDAGELAALLEQQARRPRQRLLKWTADGLMSRRWQLQGPLPESAPLAYREHGVYLITGGLGGLGQLFARELVESCSAPSVILCGRSEPSPQQQMALQALAKPGARVVYRRCDIADAGQAQALVQGVVAEFGRLDGVLHSAGLLQDEFLLRKSEQQMHRVLAPKVAGTQALDQATAELDLDFFALFSSIASWAGNVGQADYAAANGFLEQFAAWRQHQVEAGARRGRSLAIAWPHWLQGGMQIDAASLRRLEQRTGLRSMPTAPGLRALHCALAGTEPHQMVMHGPPDELVRALDALGRNPLPQPGVAAPTAPAPADNDALKAQTAEWLRQQFSSVLKIPAARIDTAAALEEYGIDSILAMDLTGQLETSFGSLAKTLFFEYQTIDALAEYLLRAHRPRLLGLLGAKAQPESASAVVPVAVGSTASTPIPTRRRPRQRFLANQAASGAAGAVGSDTGVSSSNEPIAIIGLSGRYPLSPDLQAFWENLRDGRDCIVEVPPQRWDWRQHYSADRSVAGAHYSRWGGFIEGADEFDPRFFNIAPREAAAIDPQERLFLQHAWLAIEDAGYSRAALQLPEADGLPGQIGVYAGVMYGEYNLSGSLAGIANRVSYFLNLHGPSLSLDTMCSSSLTALHLACQDLRSGRIRMALAGGVNLSVHPNKYTMLSAGQFISGDGHCQSFGEGGDGYIPGEGVGVAVLKRLSDAERDGDPIHGVIRASAINHGGKTNGYTVPNPQAQAEVIRRALREAGVDARAVSYIEAHGTGTRLGDPIEIAALTRAFEDSSEAARGARGYCLIGSAKSNIGHCESAAGIAGLSKLLLQFKHGCIVPSLHSRVLNPHIDFAATPFVVCQSLQPWQAPVLDGQPQARIGGLSSFGAGGSNAHLVVAEYRPLKLAESSVQAAQLLPLSARTGEALRARVEDLLHWIEDGRVDSDLVAIAWTLQSGREPMDERLALIASDTEQACAQLRTFLADADQGPDRPGLHRGRARPRGAQVEAESPGGAELDGWLREGRLQDLARVWVRGQVIDWSALRAGSPPPRRLHLPTYAFARERYWQAPAVTAAAANWLHPLLHRNCSDLETIRFETRLIGTESFLDKSASQACLPPLMLLEMALAALREARPSAAVEAWNLHGLVWSEAAPAASAQTLDTLLWQVAEAAVDIEIGSDADNVHWQGHAQLLDPAQIAPADAAPRLDLDALAAPLALLSEQDCSALAIPGLRSCRRQGATLGAEIRLPLEPSGTTLALPMLEALSALLRLAVGGPVRPLQLQQLRLYSALPQDISIWLGPSLDAIDVDVCDAKGLVCLQLRGLQLQPLAATAAPLAAAASPALTPAPEFPRAADPAPTALPAASPAASSRPAPALPPRLIEIALGGRPAQNAQPAPLAKPDRIALSGPSPVSAELTEPKPRIRLREPWELDGEDLPATSMADVRLFQHTDGIHVLEIRAQSVEHALPALQAGLRQLRASADLKLLLLQAPAGAWAGGREAVNATLASGVLAELAALSCPVLAALPGGACGAGLLLAAVCDFMFCAEQADYAYAEPEQGLLPSAAELDLFSARLGPAAAFDLLHQRTRWRGTELHARGWSCPVLAADQVVDAALRWAALLAQKPERSLRLLKAQLARPLLAPLAALDAQEAIELPDSGSAMPAAAQAPGSVLVRLGDGQAGADLVALLADLRFVIERVGADARYSSIVISSDLPDFLPDRAGTAAAISPPDPALLAELGQLLQACPIPVIAAFEADAGPVGWLCGLFCDQAIYADKGQYRASTLWTEPALAAAAGACCELAFGASFGLELRLSGAQLSGAELMQRAAAAWVLPAPEVLAQALAQAALFDALPRAHLHALKQGWRARRQRLLETLQIASGESMAADPGASAQEPAPTAAMTAPADSGPRTLLATPAVSVQLDQDGVALIEMHDRDSRNLFTPALVEGLQQAFDAVEAEPDCRAVVLVGYDSFFATGGTRDTLLAIQRGETRFTDEAIFQRPMDCALPVLAAVQGHAIGGGLSFGLFADLVMLSAESRYLSPYMGYGFTPGAGSTLLLPARLGLDLARESLFGAIESSGQQLRDRGAALPVLARAELPAAALDCARRIARLPRARLVALKRGWRQSILAARDETYRHELEMHAQTFVGNQETLQRIHSQFAPQATYEHGADAPARLPETVAASAPGPTPAVAGLRLIEPRRDAAAEAAEPAAASALNVDTVLDGIRTMLAQELFLEAEEIEAHTPFIDLGLDSITGVTWIRRINAQYGVDIEATRVYSHPTLDALARLVASEIEPDLRSAPVATAATSEPAALSLPIPAQGVAPAMDGAELIPHLRQMLAEELLLQPSEIDAEAQFIDLGLDSITGVTWVRRINAHYGSDIEATRVYSHSSLAAMAELLRRELGMPAPVLAPPAVNSAAQAPVAAAVAGAGAMLTPLPTIRSGTADRVLASWRQRRASSGNAVPAAIAIIGSAGRFARARNLDEFWERLAAGADCIDEVGAERWDLGRWYQSGAPAPGKTNSRWLGALPDFDCFDPLFFSISPTEAECMEPQQRVFLETGWHAIENAGYAPQSLSSSQCGVFVGCGPSDYLRDVPEQLSAQGFTGTATSILAARIAYVLNLRGPCLSIDTACSSSLVAIASACDSLNAGSSDLALAGGVYVMAGPGMHVMTAQAGMLSTDGRCYSFDQRANGFVPGEGVGVLLLKRLADAQRDGDRIQAVIEAWGVNQDGKTNGITAPNEDSQTRLLQSVYRRFGIDPAQLQLIEAHGTGTKLGDPIEVAGLKAAFKPFTERSGYCALGSVKSNIGHCLTAAGVAGVLKIVLALKHRALPPSAHFEHCNEHIRLDGSPFYVNDRLRPWQVQESQRRRAAVSSFGFSGTNAHLVLAEPESSTIAARPQPAPARAADGRLPLPLSARTAAQLRRRVEDLLAWLQASAEPVALTDLAYTLQLGRDAMDERLVFMVGSLDELRIALADWLAGNSAQFAPLQGQVRRHREELKLITQDAEMRATLVDKWLSQRQLGKLMGLWVKGLDFDFGLLYGNARPQRLALPGYPFARERYWLGRPAGTPLQERQDTGCQLQCPIWEPLQAGQPPAQALLGTCLVIGASAEQYELLVEGLGLNPARHIELAEAMDIEACAAALAEIEFVRIVQVLPSATLDLGDEAVLRAQEHGLMRCFRLARALLALGRDTQPLQWDLLSHGAFALPDDTGCTPTHAGLDGLCGSLAELFPLWRMRLLDLPEPGIEAGVEALTAINALAWNGRALTSALRHGEWFSRRRIDLDLPEAPAPYREAGVYVVIGGAGGLGEIWSRHLARKHRARLAWIGRRPLDAAIQSKLDAIAALGGQALYLQADATLPGALAEACDGVRNRFGAINGLLHSAVGAFDESLRTVSEEQFREVLAAKIDLSVRIAQAFASHRPDFLLFFSSEASFVRGAGMPGYSAGCRFKDEFALELGRRLGCPAKVVNWGYWSQGAGAAMSEAMKSYFRQTGYRPLEPEAAMAALDRFMASPLAQVSITRLETPTRELQVGDEHAELLQRTSELQSDAILHALSCAPIPTRLAALQHRPGEEMEPLLKALLAGLLAVQQSVAPGYERWLKHSRRMLAETPVDSVENLWKRWEQSAERWRGSSDDRALFTLVERCMRALPEILDGRRKATDVLFPSASLSLVEEVYKTDPASLAFNQLLGEQLATAVQTQLQQEPQRRVRLLEIGAGTGASTVGILEHLRPYQDKIEEYCYTDVSKAFLFHAEAQYLDRAPYLRTCLFDVERPLSAQGMTAGRYDFVIAANVIHATRNIRNTLRNAKALLRSDGMLFLNEISQPSLCGHLTFGLLDGWWLNEDEAIRLPGSPGLAPESWQRVLHMEGFKAVLNAQPQAHRFGQQILIAASDGLVRQSCEPVRTELKAAAVERSAPQESVSTLAAPALDESDGALLRTALDYCRQVLSRALKLDPQSLDEQEPLERYGIDSIIIGLVNQELSKRFVEIDAAALYQFRSMFALAEHLLAAHRSDLLKLNRGLGASSRPAPLAPPAAHAPVPPRANEPEELADTERLLGEILGKALRIDPAQIDPQVPLDRYGIDSISIGLVNQQLQAHFGELDPTLLFRFRSIAHLAGHLCHRPRLQAPPSVAESSEAAASTPIDAVPAHAASYDSGALPARRSQSREPIAIVGISGRYPAAPDLEQFWQNLSRGRDCVTEIPPDRWPLSGFFEADQQTAVEHSLSYCKWGAFVDGFADFDPLFFGIPPREALNMDPQERLFMQTAWAALENAAYTRDTLKRRFGSKVGVFAGITRAGYNLYRNQLGQDEKFWPRTSFASVANRLSFFLDINGPSLPVDTMCSSSLTAVHEACEHIHNGDCRLAIAGGVNLYLHPSSYIDMSSQYMLSKQGRCRSFGAGADGFVPGEGVGVLVLAPLSEALAHGDTVHALILASELNHGGRTNGFTVPNPAAQADLVRAALDKAGVSARAIGYIEAHGTGTELGDPIEISGLQQAFARDSEERGYCRIGSAKSNIGHLEAAAGIAGLTKVVLQLRHRSLAPSLHAEQLNPHIRFERTAFSPVREPTPWARPRIGGREYPRMAGVSSFGAGGANAHVILSEAPVPAAEPAAARGPFAIPLSARTAEQLRQRACDLLEWLLQDASSALDAVACTLQLGRESMEFRLGLQVDDLAGLNDSLRAFLETGQAPANGWLGELKRGTQGAASPPSSEAEAVIEQALAARDCASLLQTWVQGKTVDWRRLYGQQLPRRLELPSYPFARERYWIDQFEAQSPTAAVPMRAGTRNGDGARIEELLQAAEDCSLETDEVARLLRALV